MCVGPHLNPMLFFSRTAFDAPYLWVGKVSVSLPFLLGNISASPNMNLTLILSLSLVILLSFTPLTLKFSCPFSLLEFNSVFFFLLE